MTNTFALDDWTTLDVTEEGNDTATAIAAVRGVTITPSVSIDTLLSGDTIKVEDKLQSEFTVAVDIEYAKFDGDIVAEWLDQGGTSPVDMQDTTTPTKYSLDAVFDAHNSDEQINATVTGITFEEMPIFDGDFNEFATWDLSGDGEDLTGFSVAAPA